MKQPKWLVEAGSKIVRPSGDGPHVLVWDIETTPQAIWAWGSYQVNALGILRPWYVLCIAYKWLGEDESHFISIYQDDGFRPDYGTAKPRKNVDRNLIGQAWHLLDAADVVVAHNGDKFDQKKIVARILTHKIGPPSPYKQIDTLKETKRYANFASNRLNDLGAHLGLGEKVAHSGLHTWFGCMSGDPDQWRAMEAYNLRDIKLLEDLYLELLPWIGSPGRINPGGNAGAYDGARPLCCPKIGCGGQVIARGFLPPSAAGVIHKRWSCKKCGGWSQSRYKERDYGQQPKIK